MFVNKYFTASNYSQIKYLSRICNKAKRDLRQYSTLISEDVPADISFTQIKRILKANKLNFEEGFVNIITECPFCQFSAKEDKSKVYINKTTGLLICPSCRYTNQWNVLERFLNQQKSNKCKKEIENIRLEIKNTKERESTLWEKQLSETRVLDEELIGKNDGFMKKFHLNKIPKEILLQAEPRVDETCDNLYFPLYNADSKVVGFKIINGITGKESTLPSVGCSGILSLRKTTKPSISKLKDATAVIVLTIKDLLALHTQKLNAVPICLPYNLMSLPQQCLPALENYSKLILWFVGDDANSWDASRTFAKKFNEKRCLFVRPMENQPPAYEAFCIGHDLKHILGNAQAIWHRAITSFSALRQDVLSELQNIEKVAGVKWKRYPALNRILKGHRRGELTILTGPTGCGKTTFMSEYSLDLAMQGVNTLWGSFEIRNARLARAMLQQFSGIPLHDNLHLYDYWADKFEELPLYFMMFHGQQSVKIVMEAVEHATYVHDISHVIIDNVQFMMGISDDPRGGGDRFWKQDAIIASFRTFASRKNCHVTLVIHPRKERDDEDLTTSSIFGGAKASQEADNVLIIQDKRLTSVRGKKYLQVAKNRYSGDLGVMPLEFDKSSLSYAHKKKKDKDDLSPTAPDPSTTTSQSPESLSS